MVIRLTPNGLAVSVLVAAISASSRAGLIAPQAITPKQPAFDMAATRLRSDTQLIAPARIAYSLPRKAAPRAMRSVRRLAPSPASGTERVKPRPPRRDRKRCGERGPRVRYSPRGSAPRP